MMKWGNSLAVKIPRSIAQKAKLSAGDALEITAVGQGSIELRRVGTVLSFERLLSEITPKNRYEEIASSWSVGKESVEW
jgi:antitoxin MazE